MGQIEKQLKGKIVFKHETEAVWHTSNNGGPVEYIPAAGEKVLYDRDSNHNYIRTKYGDGTHIVAELPFSTEQPDWSQTDETAVDYIKNKPNISTVYRYCGSVATYAALPASSAASVGDVYNVIADNGMNYAWDGEKWDSLGLSVDLSNYMLKQDVVGTKTPEGGEKFNHYTNEATGANSHAEGRETVASGECAHSEGRGTIASGITAHAEGKNSMAVGYTTHAEGTNSLAGGTTKPSENTDRTEGYFAHAEGNATWAKGNSSHAEGIGTIAGKIACHAEGYYTEATGERSHAEGYYTKATSGNSHAEGSSTQATGVNSHAEGNKTLASGANSHAGGVGTIARQNSQTVIGRYNKGNESVNSLFVIGNGSESNRSNAFEVMSNNIGEVSLVLGKTIITEE